MESCLEEKMKGGQKMNNSKLSNYLGVVKGNKYMIIVLLIIGIFITIGSVSVVKNNLRDVGHVLKIIEAEKNIIKAADRAGSLLGGSYIYQKELEEYESKKTKEYIYISISIFTTISGIVVSVFMLYFLKLDLLDKKKENGIDG